MLSKSRFLLGIALLCSLVSCTPPNHDHPAIYNREDFIADSNKLIEYSSYHTPCLTQSHHLFEENIIDGDVLSIALHCPSRPDRTLHLARINQLIGFRVCNGHIQLPDLPPIAVEGLTLAEAREKLQQAYSDQLSDTKIFINFKEYRERAVFIIGAHQSTVLLNHKTRLSEILAKAQIPPYTNLYKSYIMREEQRLPINLFQLIHEGDESQNIVMRRGDLIYLANSSDAVVMVTGEVPNSKLIPVIYGSLSLKEAVAIAGGIPFTGSKKCIQIIRGNGIQPKIYCLNWEEIIHTPNDDLPLVSGDIVVVSEKPITEWNRFIGQLQPSTAGMQAAYNLYHLVTPN